MTRLKLHTPAVREERKSFCRTCLIHCGMVVSLDENEQIVAIRPDHEDLMTEGYACFKGLTAPEAHHPNNRILYPLKRQPDGTFERIGLEQALDEIAAALKTIIDRDGPEAVAGYRGSGGSLNAAAAFLLDDLFSTIGTPKLFSPTTIDQSAKLVAAERLGSWPPGGHPFPGSDVALVFGSNPLVSNNSKFGVQNPLKKLKEEIGKGRIKLLIVDPRRSESARFADVFLQPLPGEDSTIAAGMIRLILKNGWEDKEFVARNVAQMRELREAVEPFTPEYVARRADVPVDKFVELTTIFARAKRGRVQTGTGVNMGPHSNLDEHLLQVLNIICGRFIREGERIANPGVLLARYPRRCQVVPAQRSFEKGYKSRIGGYGVLRCAMAGSSTTLSKYTVIYNEMPTGIMCDEILEPGPGQVKAFINHGGNPAVIVPDQLKVVRAFRSLELLVSIDSYMTPTSKLSHYVLPTKLMYERPDLPCWQAENVFYFAKPYTRYTPAVAKPPAGSEIVEDIAIFWGLAKRLGVQLTSLGHPLDMTHAPNADDLLAIVARNAPFSFDELRQAPLGGFYEGEPQYAEPGNPGPDDKFTVCPPDVAAELGELAKEKFGDITFLSNGSRATHRLAVRRQRQMFNSNGRELPSTKRRAPYNKAMMNPADLAAIGVAAGDLIRISSETATVEMIAEPDDTLRRGVVSVVHGYGVLPEDNDYKRDGICVNILLTTDKHLQTINAMPWMTAVPVTVTPADRRNSPTNA
jgi:anaerobic selenocysteine-containing dehydrogenase